MIAAEKGHDNIVQILVQAGAKLDIQDKDDHTFFHICAAYGQPDIIKMVIGIVPESVSLLQQNDQFDNTPLHLAAEKGQTEAVRELLEEEYGVDIDNKNEDERTPCHLAARNGHVDILKLIIKKDSFAIFDKDEDDNTPLHMAAKQKQAEAVEFLLSQGASVHKRNSKSWTALDCAAAAGCYDSAVLLLNHDSPVDPLDRKNITPLHLSAMFGHDKITQLLLDHDADLELENDIGMNALELAIFHQNKKCVEVILENRNWRLAMKSINNGYTDRGEIIPNTPLRMLIRNYPDLVENVFDKCIKTTPSTIEMDFEFIDDTFTMKKTINKKTGRPRYYHVELSEENMTPYDETGTLTMINHPLMLMVNEKQKILLKHPLCLALLRRKWKSIGRIVFYSQFYIYLLFMIFLTAHILYKLNSKTFPDESNHSEFLTQCGLTNDPTEQGLQVMVIFFTVLNIIIEISQIIRVKYFY